MIVVCSTLSNEVKADMAQIIGRDCGCEDFPCCGHGITEADLRDMCEELEEGVEVYTPESYVTCQSCGDDVHEDRLHVVDGDPVCRACCGCGAAECAR